MSKNLDIEFFENIESTGYTVYLPTIIALPGKYQQSVNNKITIEGTETSVKYNRLFYIDKNRINWNSENKGINGITIIELAATDAIMNNELGNAKFLFFDVVSTYSIGSMTLLQGEGASATIEICQTTFKNLESLSRSTIKLGQVQCDGNSLNYIINSQHFNVMKSTEYRGADVNGLTICINLDKKITYPPCPSNYEKCWIQDKYQEGLCFNAKTNSMYTTYCTDKTKCFLPTKSEGVNFWQNGNLGSGRVGCDGPPVSGIKSKQVEDVNTVVGKGISNLKDGTNRMAANAANLRSQIKEVQDRIERQHMDLSDKNRQIGATQELVEKNKEIIKKKMQILESRNRQLELSIDRNVYWKKVLYVLFAIIIIIIMILLFFSSFMKKAN